MADTTVISPTAFFERTIGKLGPSTDYHRQYLFQVWLYPIPGVSDSSIITYFMGSTQSPVETTGVINVPWMNSEVKIGGQTKYAEWSVTVRDDTTSMAYNYFKMWRRLVYQTKDGAGELSGGQSHIPNQYKYPIDLYLLDNRGNHDRGYKIVNAWPGSIGQMTLDYATEGIITFPVTINFDEFEPTV